jgi:HTH-type transcriptional regulator/antitoxin HigA
MKTNGNTVNNLVEHWRYIAPLATMPKNARELDKLMHLLDELLDATEGNENHPLSNLIELISSHIEIYENEQYAKSLGNGIDALKYLMKIHGIKQSELPEIGSQGVVSEVLSRKRQLNKTQIDRLAKRFGVSPATFF